VNTIMGDEHEELDKQFVFGRYSAEG